MYMKKILILFSILLFTVQVFAESERPQAIVIPISSLGAVTKSQKQILQNTLEDNLKSYFTLISQELFEQAQEKAFEELDYEECTEDQCIMLIQEMLQVENVFHLQVLGEGDDTQLSLSWKTLDEKKKETDVCIGCGTFQLNEKVGGLVGKLVGKSVVEKPFEVIEKSQIGVLFRKLVYGEWEWLKNGNEKRDWKYVGEIRNGVPNGKGTITLFGKKYEGDVSSQFLDDLEASDFDETMNARLGKALSHQSVLRYAFTIDVDAGSVEVGISEVTNRDPKFRLKKNENLVSFKTRRYSSSPLIVKGSAAGADSAAACDPRWWW